MCIVVSDLLCPREGVGMCLDQLIHSHSLYFTGIALGIKATHWGYMFLFLNACRVGICGVTQIEEVSAFKNIFLVSRTSPSGLTRN